MPCTDGGPTYDEINTSTIKNLEKMLCYVLTRLKNKDSLSTVLKENEELSNWWEQHQEEDKIRIKNEEAKIKQKNLKKKALKKLSPQERAALGLNESFD